MRTIITPSRSWLRVNIEELVRYKDLFYYLAWRDIKVRYKQTTIGLLWALFVPFITMVVFSIFFGNFAGIASSSGAPYPIFVYIGLLFWTFFSQAVINSSNSLVASQDIVKKIYFPRLLLPAASILVTLLDFAVAAVILGGMLIYYSYTPTALCLVVLPLAIIIAYLSSLGLGLFLAAVNVKFRDVRYVVAFLIQMLLFLTPVIYPITIVSEQFRPYLQINPMTGVIEASRAAILGEIVPWHSLGIAAAVSIGLVVLGLFYFQKTEREFADVI